MERQPLTSLEYESTYLELRPDCEWLSDATDASLPARRPGDVPVHHPVASSYGTALADSGIVRPGPRTISAPLLYLGPRTVARAHATRCPAGPPVALLCRSTRPPFSAFRSDQLAARHRSRSWKLLGPGPLVVASASLGIVAELDVRATRILFVALTGVLLLGWARLAWRGTARPRPFDAAVARVLDRLVTALGTFFALALWARYAPQASAAFSKTVVLAFCAVGLIGGLTVASHKP